MISGFTFTYSILLWLGTGAFILWLDVKAFELAKLDKERKTARFAGWFNLATGLAMSVWSFFS